jgi:hypothetical protein
MKPNPPVWRVALDVLKMALLGVVCASFIVVLLMSIFSSVFADVVIQTVCLLLFFSFVYAAAWRAGDHDVTNLERKQETLDNLKGLKAGLLASIPFALTSVTLILPKLGLTPDISFVYKLLNCYVYTLNNLILSPQEIASINWIAIAGATVLQIFLVTFPAALGYFLGSHRISLMEQLVYKKNQ